MNKPVLQVNDLTMQFGGVVAVNNLSMTIHQGEIVALIGPNGAGKTTAFNAITGVYLPTNGEVKLLDEVIQAGYPQGKMKKLYAGDNHGRYTSIVDLTPDKITKRGIARTFQNIRLFKNLSVFDNVLIAHHMNMKSGLFSAAFRLNHAEEEAMRKETWELLRMVRLDNVAMERANNLPYGKQRHLEIARALATHPRLLLLDEPAAGMNPQETEELSGFIREIKDLFDLTILVIEHHMNLVMDLSDRIYVIDFGRLIAQGTPEVVQNDPAVITAYLGVDE
ncbi:MAG TPA: ABC transporter ATP-binding protein [Tissierellia bacterium]|nr:ABC transporter ATP-binding protein [Tissierellia bacterium]